MPKNKDQIYRDRQAVTEKFQFNAEVSAVFEDMISRSVPGYRQILDLIPTLVRSKHQLEGNYYDLGCSLGAGMLALANAIPEAAAGAVSATRAIIGVDNSAAMLKQANALLESTAESGYLFELRNENIRDLSIKNAAIVLMNFTLQFIAVEERVSVLEKVYDNTVGDGVLVLSEKLAFEDSETNNTLIDIHHQFKADQGYSQLEIAQKRDAIENVLIPETLETHVSRLRSVGYSVVTPWVQNLQFISILAVK